MSLSLLLTADAVLSEKWSAGHASRFMALLLADVRVNSISGKLPMKSIMPAEGIEPTRSCDHWILSPARLPVPPRRRRRDQATK